MKAIGLAGALAILVAMPAKAELEHCQGATVQDLLVIPPAKRAQWLTEELATCDLTAETQAIAYNNRGVAFAELGEWQMAINDFDQAIALDPIYVNAYGNRATAYCQVKPARISESLADAAKMASLDREKTIEWQRLLASLSYYNGPIDGDWGPASQDAWLRFCAATAAAQN